MIVNENRIDLLEEDFHDYQKHLYGVCPESHWTKIQLAVINKTGSKSRLLYILAGFPFFLFSPMPFGSFPVVNLRRGRDGHGLILTLRGLKLNPKKLMK